MSDIRILSTEADFDAFVNIVMDSYPGVFERSEERRQQLVSRTMEAAETYPTVTLWGLFRRVDGEERLLGGMRLFDYQMNFLNSDIPAGGVGQVAVAMEHRREHVAKELMLFYLRHYRQRGAPLALLYPFRPDFYRKMGFGYGTKMSRYRLDPGALPRGREAIRLRALGADDGEAIRACYERYTRRTHGMIHKTDREMAQLFKRQGWRVVGYEEGGQLFGYLVFSFEQGDTFLVNDLHVRELIYETRDALAALLAYLGRQQDQVRRIILRTQDDSFHHLLDDPRDGSDRLISPVYHATDLQGVGLMYRVIDVPGMFRLLEERDFGGETCELTLSIRDTFLPENAGLTHLVLDKGRVRVVDRRPPRVDRRSEAFDERSGRIEIEMDIGSFSALLAGTVTFERLHTYGLAEISDPDAIDTVSTVFDVRQKPICTTAF